MIEPGSLNYGMSPQSIATTLQTQSGVSESGRVEVDGNYLRISPTGEFLSEQMIADLYIGGPNGLVRLGEVAKISRGYNEPRSQIMRFNGEPAIALGISTTAGGNVVNMGQSIKERLAELDSIRPAGMELHPIYFQSEIVTESVNAFVVNLAEAVLIVIVSIDAIHGMAKRNADRWSAAPYHSRYLHRHVRIWHRPAQGFSGSSRAGVGYAGG